MSLSGPYFEIQCQLLALLHPFILVLQKRIDELQSLLEIEIVSALLLFPSNPLLLRGILHLHLMEATLMLHLLRDIVIVPHRIEEGDLLKSLELSVSLANFCAQLLDSLSKLLHNAFCLFCCWSCEEEQRSCRFDRLAGTTGKNRWSSRKNIACLRGRQRLGVL